ncbi:hydantoinase/oxoprolinase family protein [Syntrophomonas erecta]
MLIGIDVGGTYTDGVVFAGKNIVATAKKPTNNDHLEASLLGVLDQLLADMSSSDQVTRVVLSTTLVTNLIATGRTEPTALIIMPGYGLPYSSYEISSHTYFIKGAIDFRGREIDHPDDKEIKATVARIYDKGIRRVAIAGKFSNRNPAHENRVAGIIKKTYPDLQVVMSCNLSSRLNFPRRAATAYFTAMIQPEWQIFAEKMAQSVKERLPGCELHFLKADGGTMPLESSLASPCETVFSGPAASTMGAVALIGDNQNAVVVDIGGTTSDLSLIVGGQPLYASHGARLEGHYTHIDAFSVKSIPLGGDSALLNQQGKMVIASYRLGPAVCFGGSYPTVTDAYNYSLQLKVGDFQRSEEKLKELARGLKMDVTEMCQRVVTQVNHRLTQAVQEMFTEWENEPAYRVWEVVNRTKFRLDQVIGIGAAAPAIIPGLAQELEVDGFIHRYAPVANALGAALVRPTLAVYLHIDTQQGICSLEPGGVTQSLHNPRKFQLEEARKLALDYLNKLGAGRGMNDYLSDYSFFQEEQFNLVRGWDRVGKIFDVGVQIAPGFIKEYQGVSI